MNIQDFYKLVSRTKQPEPEMTSELKFLVDKYPYFQSGLFIYLKSLYINDEENFRPELFRLSAFILDKKALFYYVFSEEYSRFKSRTGKNELSKDRTSVLLDAFFETLDDNQDEHQLEYSITNSSMASLDYFSFLESAETIKNEGLLDDTPKMRHQSVIDDFISKAEDDADSIKINVNKADLENSEELSEQETEDDTLDDDDIFFSETLANIYIKQRKYQKAQEIIQRLSLNYPEKNIYFADQLSFLEKLIINSKKIK